MDSILFFQQGWIELKFYDSQNKKINWDIKVNDAFELFDFDKKFSICDEQLEDRYLILSKACHPDHLGELEEEERTKVLQASSQVNGAYRDLKNPLTRAEILLQIKSKEVSAVLDSKDLPQGFLMEMLELQEELEDLDLDLISHEQEERLEEIESTALTSIEEIVNSLTTTFNAFDEDRSLSHLEKLRRDLNCVKYHQRIAEIAERLLDNV